MSEHAHCEDCGMLYGSIGWADVVIPDAIWNSLGVDLLCFNCMTAALVRAGHKNVPVLVASGPYVCDSEKWRLLGWDHGNKVGRQDADSELLAALRECRQLADGLCWVSGGVPSATTTLNETAHRLRDRLDAALVKHAPKVKAYEGRVGV